MWQKDQWTESEVLGEHPSTRKPRWFCPRCQRARTSVTELCAECGERLKPKGYCQVCHDYWSLDAGQLCPKHDLPLETELAEPHLETRFETSESWTTVETYMRPFEAEAARLRLDAEGIPAIVSGSGLSLDSAYQMFLGGIKLQVPRSYLQDARILLAQSWAIPENEDDEEDLEWDDSDVKIVDTDSQTRSIIFWGVLLSLLVIVAGLLKLV